MHLWTVPTRAKEASRHINNTHTQTTIEWKNSADLIFTEDKIEMGPASCRSHPSHLVLHSKTLCGGGNARTIPIVRSGAALVRPIVVIIYFRLHASHHQISDNDSNYSLRFMWNDVEVAANASWSHQSDELSITWQSLSSAICELWIRAPSPIKTINAATSTSITGRQQNNKHTSCDAFV